MLRGTIAGMCLTLAVINILIGNNAWPTDMITSSVLSILLTYPLVQFGIFMQKAARM
jgi:hypothetical protein